MEKKYRLRHRPTQQESQAYSFERVHYMLNNSTDEEISSFEIFSETQSDWIDLKQHIDFFPQQKKKEKTRVHEKTQAQEKNRRAVDHSDSEIPVGLDLNLIRRTTKKDKSREETSAPKIQLKQFHFKEASKANDGIEKRRDFRIQIRIPVMISNGKKSLRTFTKNVSSGGVQLSQGVPEEFKGRLSLFLFPEGSTQPLHLFCEPLPSPHGVTNRLSLASLDPESRSVYQAWAKNLRFKKKTLKTSA